MLVHRNEAGSLDFWLCDFGHSLPMDDMWETTQEPCVKTDDLNHGTPGFMAPEVEFGKRGHWTVKADVYVFGIYLLGLLDNYGSLWSSPGVFDEVTDCIVPRTALNVNKPFKARMVARYPSGTLLPFLFWGLLIKAE